MFEEIIPISALKNDATDVVVSTLVKYLPVHPPLYPVDYLSDMPERFFVSEIIREKIFEYYRDEIPYSTEVLITDFKEREDETDQGEIDEEARARHRHLDLPD